MNNGNNRIFLDNDKLDTVIDSLNDTANEMDIDDYVFTNEAITLGTDAMVSLASIARYSHTMANAFKPHMTIDIVPVLKEAQDNHNKLDRELAAQIRVK